MENEIWKPVIGYENHYEVSNRGNVRSLMYKGGRHIHTIHQTLKPSGYYEVILTENKKSFYKPVHRLVAEAFVPNPHNKLCVDHIDTNRQNNNASNLRWCTHKENANNPISRKHQRIAQAVEMKKKWEKGLCERIKKPVLQYSLQGLFIKRWESATSAARACCPQGKRVDSMQKGITSCCRGEKRQCMGFVWIYEDYFTSAELPLVKDWVPKSIRVEMTFPDGRIRTFDSINKASKATGIQNTTIRRRTYSKWANISWRLLNTETCYTNNGKKTRPYASITPEETP